MRVRRALTEEQVRCALGATALPSAPVTAEFGIPATTTADMATLHRAPLRVETAFGSIRASVMLALIIAALVALTLTPRIGAEWALLSALAIAVAVDTGVVRFLRWRNRGRASWLPGQDLQVFDLEPGTWIETPLNLRATSSDMTAYALGARPAFTRLWGCPTLRRPAISSWRSLTAASTRCRGRHRFALCTSSPS